jgi:hypothetical protein
MYSRRGQGQTRFFTLLLNELPSEGGVKCVPAATRLAGTEISYLMQEEQKQQEATQTGINYKLQTLQS